MSCLRRSLDGDNADQVRIRLLDHDQEQYRDRDELLDEALDDVLTHEDLQHTIGSFSAIVLPVTITMILARCIPVYSHATIHLLKTYIVWQHVLSRIRRPLRHLQSIHSHTKSPIKISDL